MTSKTKDKELWKAVPGYEGYEASTLGRIRNKKGKILSPVKYGPKRKQYFSVYMGGGRISRKIPVHRIILTTFSRNPKSGDFGCHKDDDQFNNAIDNLYWGTAKQNVSDQMRLGKFKNADPIHTTKFSKETVCDIRKEYTGRRGEQTKLSKKYGMSISNVNLIVNGKTRVS